MKSHFFDLTQYLARRFFFERYKTAGFGIGWTIIEPILNISLYTYVFGYIFKGSFSEIPGNHPAVFGLGVFAGYIIFSLITDCLGGSVLVLKSKGGLIRKANLNIFSIQLAFGFACYYRFFVNFILLLIGCRIIQGDVGVNWISCLIVIVASVPLVFGIIILFSALGVFFPDVQQSTPIISTILLWASGVFYSYSSIPNVETSLLRFNPVLQLIYKFRVAVFSGNVIEFDGISLIIGLGLILCFFGILLIKSLREVIPDLI